MRGMNRPTDISLSATARLLGVDVARVYRLARQGRLGKVVHPDRPGKEAAVPVAAVERFALRIFSDQQIEAACVPHGLDAEYRELRSICDPYADPLN